MKKKILSIMLVLCLCIAMAVPAFAIEPTAPIITDLSVVPGDTALAISWAALDGGSPILGYTLTVDDGADYGQIFSFPAGTNGYTLGGLENDVYYTITLTAMNAVGSSMTYTISKGYDFSKDTSDAPILIAPKPADPNETQSNAVATIRPESTNSDGVTETYVSAPDISETLISALNKADSTNAVPTVNIRLDPYGAAKAVRITVSMDSVRTIVSENGALRFTSDGRAFTFGTALLSQIADSYSGDSMTLYISSKVEAPAKTTDLEDLLIEKSPYALEVSLTAGGKTLEVSDVEVSIASLDDSTVFFTYDSASGLSVVPSSIADKKITFDASLPNVYYAAALPFDDVPAAEWYAGSVLLAYTAGIMGGEDDGFNPEDPMTRSMVWTVLARLDGADLADSDPWYAKAQQWSIDYKISDGTDPDAPVTREQLVTLLWRFAKNEKMDVSVGEETNILSYEDAFDIEEYAIPAFQWACGAGITSGYNGYLEPQANATRAEVAAMLVRFLGA